MKFTTENGSVYELNRVKMTWARVSKGAESGKIRQESGKLVFWPRIDVGWTALLSDTNVRPGAQVHYIHTSKVVKIEGVTDGIDIH